MSVFKTSAKRRFAFCSCGAANLDLKSLNLGRSSFLGTGSMPTNGDDWAIPEIRYRLSEEALRIFAHFSRTIVTHFRVRETTLESNTKTNPMQWPKQGRDLKSDPSKSDSKSQLAVFAKTTPCNR